MNEKEKLIKYKKIIDESLARFFYNQKKQLKSRSNFFNKLLDNFAEYTLRKSNKRIRAILVILGYQLFGGRDFRKILTVAQSIELIHSSLLIHDDIFDQDLYRRGGLSFHYIFEKFHRDKFKKGDSEHFGHCMGILAGDIGFAFAVDNLINSKFSDNTKFKILDKFNKMYYDTCYGQATDVLNSYKERVKEKDVFEVYKYKTAKYTIETPLFLGATSAGVSDKNLQLLSKFALPLGIAFQIKDDILGMFGSREKIGKPITSDLEEGKMTLLILKSLKRLKIKERTNLLNILKKGKISFNELNLTKKFITLSGAYDYCQNLASKLVRKSLSYLNKIRGKKEIKELLKFLANYIIQRDY